MNRAEQRMRTVKEEVLDKEEHSMDEKKKLKNNKDLREIKIQW